MKYLTAQQAADELQTSEDRICDLIHAGELIGRNIARSGTGKRACWRILRSDLEAFLDRRSSRPPTAAPSPSRRQRAAAAPKEFVT